MSKSEICDGFLEHSLTEDRKKHLPVFYKILKEEDWFRGSLPFRRMIMDAMLQKGYRTTSDGNVPDIKHIYTDLRFADRTLRFWHYKEGFTQADFYRSIALLCQRVEENRDCNMYFFDFHVNKHFTCNGRTPEWEEVVRAYRVCLPDEPEAK